MTRFNYYYQHPQGVEFPVCGNNLTEAMASVAAYPFGNLLARDNDKEYIVAKREDGNKWRATPECSNVLEL